MGWNIRWRPCANKPTTAEVSGDSGGPGGVSCWQHATYLQQTNVASIESLSKRKYQLFICVPLSVSKGKMCLGNLTKTWGMPKPHYLPSMPTTLIVGQLLMRLIGEIGSIFSDCHNFGFRSRSYIMSPYVYHKHLATKQHLHHILQ